MKSLNDCYILSNGVKIPLPWLWNLVSSDEDSCEAVKNAAVSATVTLTLPHFIKTR